MNWKAFNNNNTIIIIVIIIIWTGLKTALLQKVPVLLCESMPQHSGWAFLAVRSPAARQ